MKFLLDTCVISELVKKAPESRVVDWLNAQVEEQLALSVLTLGELRKGVAKIETDSARWQKLSVWLAKVELQFAGRVLYIDEQVVAVWGVLCGANEARGHKLPVIDSLIAATAKAHDLVLVTRNVSDFAFAELTVVNPWDE